MKNRYLDYAHYNQWANNRLICDLLKVDPQLLDQTLVGSFPTIRATILHLWFVETGWLSRLQGKGWEASNVSNFSGDHPDLFKSWRHTSEQFKDFVADAKLERKIEFKHNGTSFLIPSHEIVQTVFNHGSFHRGQVVMMMRQLEISEISKTDYIEWVRIQVSQELI